MRSVSCDSYPHLISCLTRKIRTKHDTTWARLLGIWWAVEVGRGCSFVGLPHFRRHPGSRVCIGNYCKFNSSSTSNLIGVNRPCIISTLKKDAEIIIGKGCGFSGTVIGSGQKIVIGDNVRCGANTLITNTDWHVDDCRTGPDAPVYIKKNVWLGINVTVLKGVTIGQGTLVGAGSLVTTSLPSDVVAAGIPAKVIRKIIT